MASIYPFRGFRYAADAVGDFSKVVTQPYDKIPEALRLDYLERSPHNIVRVIRNPEYGEAGRFLEQWIREGVLRRESEPCLYAYEQVFEFAGEKLRRLGLIGLVGLGDPELRVKGHEKVLEGPLADRLNLIRETRANEGLVFMLFSDPERRIDQALHAALANWSPLLEVVDDFSVRNRLWAISDTTVISQIRGGLEGCALYIADGHHRFETSVAYYRECLAKGLVPRGSESFDKRMVALFNMEAEGMRILPTHRGVRLPARAESSRLQERLGRLYEIATFPSEDALWKAVESAEHCLGFAVNEGGDVRFLSAVPRAGVLEDPHFMSGVAQSLRRLDVSLLHSGVLQKVLGIGPEQVAAGGVVEYFRDREELLERVRQGEFELGCFLRATSLHQVREIAEHGLKMPQKSTDFFPKLLTGLVLMRMEIGEKSDA